MRSLAFKDHMFCNLLKAEICFLKYCIYCENYIFSDLLHCAFVKIHKANIIIQKYCQIRFGSCTELFNGSESFQFSFFSFQFYIGFNDPSFLSKESQQLYEIWWFATTLILIRLELGISMTFRFGCQGTPSHWLHSTLPNHHNHDKWEKGILMTFKSRNSIGCIQLSKVWIPPLLVKFITYYLDVTLLWEALQWSVTKP